MGYHPQIESSQKQGYSGNPFKNIALATIIACSSSNRIVLSDVPKRKTPLGADNNRNAVRRMFLRDNWALTAKQKRQIT